MFGHSMEVDLALLAAAAFLLTAISQVAEMLF